MGNNAPPTTTNDDSAVGDLGFQGFWLESEHHRNWLKSDSEKHLNFFRASFDAAGGYHQLDTNGQPIAGATKELFATCRLVHSFALGKHFGFPDCDQMIDHGMRFLLEHHRDPIHGGYVWGLDDGGICDERKLAYGHVFVLLAAASAKQAGHPDADTLLQDIEEVLEDRFWEEDRGLFLDEANRDWTPFSTYRGFNANMHGTEALLAAFEATGQSRFLDKAGRILEFFVHGICLLYTSPSPRD